MQGGPCRENNYKAGPAKVQEGPCIPDRNAIMSLALRTGHRDSAGEHTTWGEAEGEKPAQQEEATGGDALHP
jgi:hypothetical protein